MLHLTRPDGSRPEDFHMSRRGLAAALFFSGYAPFALSADAQPIHTDEAGLVTGPVMLPAADRMLPAYVARPAAPGRHPAIVVVSEIFGLHEFIKDVCRRLAKLGYVAVAPAFFVRAGDPAPLTDMGAIMRIVDAAPDRQVIGDVHAALKFLKAQPYADVERLGIVGFCWGGRVAWQACEIFPEFKAGAAWYGHLAPDPGEAPGKDKFWPLSHVGELRAPVIGLYGGLDKGIPQDQVEAMRAALKSHGDTVSQLIVYPDAQHGFLADYRASYNAPDAQDAWARMLAFFAQHGLAAG